MKSLIAQLLAILAKTPIVSQWLTVDQYLKVGFNAIENNSNYDAAIASFERAVNRETDAYKREIYKHYFLIAVEAREIVRAFSPQSPTKAQASAYKYWSMMSAAVGGDRI